MKENKLVKMVLLFLSNGEQPRHKVSSKIKNYPKEMQADAIEFLIKGGLISIRENRDSNIGRNPSYISLTDKGAEKSSGYSEKPEHKSIWSV